MLNIYFCIKGTCCSYQVRDESSFGDGCKAYLWNFNAQGSLRIIKVFKNFNQFSCSEVLFNDNEVSFKVCVKDKGR